MAPSRRRKKPPRERSKKWRMKIQKPLVSTSRRLFLTLNKKRCREHFEKPAVTLQVGTDDGEVLNLEALINPGSNALGKSSF